MSELVNQFISSWIKSFSCTIWDPFALFKQCELFNPYLKKQKKWEWWWIWWSGLKRESGCFWVLIVIFLFWFFFSLDAFSSITVPTKIFQFKEIVKVREFKEMKRTRSKNDKEVDQHVVFVTVDQSNLWGWAVAGWKLLIYCHNY